MGVHHAIGVMFFDQKGAAIVMGPIIFIERADLTPEPSVPVQKTIALGDYVALTRRQFVRHQFWPLYFTPPD